MADLGYSASASSAANAGSKNAVETQIRGPQHGGINFGSKPSGLQLDQNTLLLVGAIFALWLLRK